MAAVSFVTERRFQPRRWQATQWPSLLRFSTGSSREHSALAIGQRVWKWQPDGGLMGLGTSPSSLIRLRPTRGSGIGTADSSASVYGCSGLL